MNMGRVYLFEGTLFDWVALGIALGALLYLSVQAIQRQNKRRLTLRLVFTSVALVSLVLIAWQPGIAVSPRPVEAVLYTQGARPGQVRGIVDSLNTSDVFQLSGTTAARQGMPAATTVPDIGFLVRNNPEISSLHIVGEGVPSYALHALRGLQVQRHPVSPRPGIQSVNVLDATWSGQPVRIQGQVFLDGDQMERGPLILFLDGPGGRSDSVSILTEGVSTYTLADLPRQAGRYEYHLTLEEADGDTLSTELLGVVIRDPVPLNILVLQGAPRFETRHLKDWVAQAGGQMAIRSTVSQDRYRNEFVNQPERDLSSLTSTLLGLFDVVLVDRRALASFSVNERRVLQRAVEEEGLGLLFDADLIETQGVRGLEEMFKVFQGGEMDEGEGRRVRLGWEGQRLASSIPAVPYMIRPGWGIEPLMRGEDEQVVAAVRQQGLGRLGISLVTETYRWVLEGNPAMHAAYWSYLLSALAQERDGMDQWDMQVEGLAFRDAPVRVVLDTSDPAPRGYVAVGEAVDTVYLAQDLVSPSRWQGTYWPQQVGWHRISRPFADSSSATPFWFFVHEPTTWQALQSAENMKATAAFAATSSEDGVQNERPLTKRPLPLGWFFALFLLSSAGLWIESKL